MPWDCRFDKSALKDLQKLPKLQRKRIVQAITSLANDPHAKNNNLKRLSGTLAGMYRLRVGNYRVIYMLEQDSQAIFIKAVLIRNEKTYK